MRPRRRTHRRAPRPDGDDTRPPARGLGRRDRWGDGRRARPAALGHRPPELLVRRVAHRGRDAHALPAHALHGPPYRGHAAALLRLCLDVDETGRVWRGRRAVALGARGHAHRPGGGRLRRDPRRPSVWGAALGVGAVGLALLPFAIARRSRGTHWIHGIPLELRLRQIAEQFAGGFSASRAIVGAAAALMALALGGLMLAADRPTRRAAVAALATAAVAIALPLVLGRFGLDYLITRNVLFILVPLTVLVAIGLAALPVRWLGATAAVGLAAIGITAAARVDASAALQRPDWRLVAGALGPRVSNRAIVVAGSYRGRPVKTYLPHTGFMSEPPPAVREIDVIGMRPPREPRGWWGGA